MIKMQIAFNDNRLETEGFSSQELMGQSERNAVHSEPLKQKKIYLLLKVTKKSF